MFLINKSINPLVTKEWQTPALVAPQEEQSFSFMQPFVTTGSLAQQSLIFIEFFPSIVIQNPLTQTLSKLQLKFSLIASSFTQTPQNLMVSLTIAILQNLMAFIKTLARQNLIAYFTTEALKNLSACFVTLFRLNPIFLLILQNFLLFQIANVQLLHFDPFV